MIQAELLKKIYDNFNNKLILNELSNSIITNRLNSTDIRFPNQLECQKYNSIFLVCDMNGIIYKATFNINKELWLDEDKYHLEDIVAWIYPY